MAIQTGKYLKTRAQEKTAKRLAGEYAAQQRKAKKRKGWSSLLGGVGGKLLGGAAVGALGLTGFGAPLAMGLSAMLAKKGAHEATRGMGAKTGGLKGDKYGFGKEEATTLRETLEGQMAVDPFKERGGLGRELSSAYLSAALAGDLPSIKEKGLTGLLSKESFVEEGKGLLGGGTEGFKTWGKELFGGASKGIEGGMAAIDTTEATDVLGRLESQFGSQSYLPQETFAAPEDYIQEPILGPGFQQGGQVPNQEELLMLLALAEAQNQKAYDNTPLEEVRQPTISEYFGTQNKTLGGSNTKSLSQMLGR